MLSPPAASSVRVQLETCRRCCAQGRKFGTFDARIHSSVQKILPYKSAARGAYEEMNFRYWLSLAVFSAGCSKAPDGPIQKAEMATVAVSYFKVAALGYRFVAGWEDALLGERPFQ